MILIYGKELGCAYCTMAKKICDSLGVSYDFFEVGVDISIDDLKLKMGVDIKQQISIPQIWVDEFYIGGCTELMKYKNKL